MIFQGTFDELLDVDVGLGEPETTSAGGPNLGFSYSSCSSTFRDDYNPLNAVSTQRLIVNQAIDLPCCPTGLPRCLARADAL